MKLANALHLLLLWVCIAGVLNACSTSSQTTSTPIPTLTLIPATSTPTPTAVSPTKTIPVRTNPDTLPITPSPTQSVGVEQTVRVLVGQAVDALAQELDMDEDQVTLVEVQNVTWSSPDLGCTPVNFPGVTAAVEGYRLLFEVEGDFYIFHTDRGSELRQCDTEDAGIGMSQSLVDIDPVAAEFVALARRRVQTAVEVDSDEISLVSVRAYRWTDTSLGCPLAGNTYESAEVDGYRIVLETSDETFIFHTSFEQLVSCDASREVLPD